MAMPPDGTPKDRNCAIMPVAVILIGAALFGVSVWQRSHAFGDAGLSMAGWTTAGSAVTAANWHREGAWRLRFVMYWAPDSIELDALGPREPYISFPPGSIIPIYLLAKASRRDPTPAMVMGYSLFIHLMTTLTLGMLTYRAARLMKLCPGVSTLFAIAPMALYLWLPSPFYEHQMGYFSDQAVMLPFAASLLVELLLWNISGKTQRRRLQGLQAAIQFWGVFTDWLFVFVAACLWAVRALRGDFGRRPLLWMGRAIRYWAPAALALALYTAQLWHLGAFEDIASRFRLRAGVGEERKYAVQRGHDAFSFGGAYGAGTRFWWQHMKDGYGPWGRTLVGVTLAAVVVSTCVIVGLRLRKKPIPSPLSLCASLGFLGLAPCLIYLLIFQQHCSYFLHGFTALKFALPIAAIPFAMLPAAVAALAAVWIRASGVKGALEWGVAALALACAAGYLWTLAPARAAIYREQIKDHIAPARFIGAHTDYADVVFSPDHAIADRPPQVIVYSMKQVHKTAELADIIEITDRIEDEFTLNIFIRYASTQLTDGVKRIADHASERIESEGMLLLKIPRDAFYALVSDLEDAPDPAIISNAGSR